MYLAPDLPDYMVYRPAYDDGQPGMYWGCNIHTRDFGHWFTSNAPQECLEEARRHAREQHGWEPGVITMSSEES